MPYADPEIYREYQKKYREQNRERLAAYDRERKQAANVTPKQREQKRVAHQAWYYRHQDVLQGEARDKSKVYRTKLRREVLEAYGGETPECACCFEDIPQFLALDHIDGGGAAHRREIGSRNSNTMFLWAKRNGYPPIFQVLCHNCNLAKGFYGECPHARMYERAQEPTPPRRITRSAG